MIALSEVAKRFREPLLRDVTLTVGKGERLGLIGPAASGKTVLAKMIAGLVRPDAGQIVVDSTDVGAASETALGPLRARFGMLFQNVALFDFMTVAENVAFPLERRGGLARGEIDDRVAERLRAVGLAGSETKHPAELSGGMKRRAGIARATVARPDIVIYDEPTAGLDPVTTQKIYDLLAADHEASGATVLAISSDVAALRRFCPRVAMLHEGRIRYLGPSEAMDDAGDAAVRQFVRGELEGPLT